jgi:hypothetical protein
MFKQARALLGPKELDELGTQMEARKRELSSLGAAS